MEVQGPLFVKQITGEEYWAFNCQNGVIATVDRPSLDLVKGRCLESGPLLAEAFGYDEPEVVNESGLLDVSLDLISRCNMARPCCYQASWAPDRDMGAQVYENTLLSIESILKDEGIEALRLNLLGGEIMLEWRAASVFCARIQQLTTLLIEVKPDTSGRISLKTLAEQIQTLVLSGQVALPPTVPRELRPCRNSSRRPSALCSKVIAQSVSAP